MLSVYFQLLIYLVCLPIYPEGDGEIRKYELCGYSSKRVSETKYLRYVSDTWIFLSLVDMCWVNFLTYSRICDVFYMYL